MLRHLIHSVAASLPPVSLRWEPLPVPRTAMVRRPVWDDGVNYDIPAYLRPRRSRAGQRDTPPGESH